MFKFIKNIFKKNNKLVYKVLIIREGVLAIISDDKINKSLEGGVDPVKNSVLVCKLTLKDLPLHNREKKVLSSTGALYFYENQDNKISTYKEVYEKVRNIKK